MRCGVSNLVLINNAKKFNIAGNNASSFGMNVQEILDNVNYAEIRWEKTVYSNSRVIPHTL
jgi:hypothetical protein